MDTEPLSSKIRELAEHLREQADTPAGATDIAAMGSALTTLIDAHHARLDHALDGECRAVVSDLTEVKRAMMDTTPDLTGAIHRILKSVETIATAVAVDGDIDRERIKPAIVTIIEACRDHESAGHGLTGAPDILAGLVSRMERLIETLGVDENEKAARASAAEKAFEEDAPSHVKPILKPARGEPDPLQVGRETTQEEIDALFN